MADVDISHQLHGLLPIAQPGMISVYRALKQRPRTGMIATRFDIPVTVDTEPGRILREIYNLWPDLSNKSSRAFQLIPILQRSLSILHRPLSDTAYLLVLSRSLEMKQRALIAFCRFAGLTANGLPPLYCLLSVTGTPCANCFDTLCLLQQE